MLSVTLPRQFVSISRGLVTFKLDVREMQTEVENLTQFEHLDTLKAYRSRLPSYPVEANRPLVRTVQYTRDQAHLHAVDGCRYLSKHSKVHFHLAALPRDPREWRRCRPSRFTYDDPIIDVLPNLRIPKLDTPIVLDDAGRNREEVRSSPVWSKAVARERY